MKYVAYYRVSTKEQGGSGLGLEAQAREAKRVAEGDIIAEFTEIESGNNNKRPVLREAMEACRKEGATLLIAKLDRLSRNIAFITALMEEKVRFRCCDLPVMDEFSIHIFAAVAEKERKLISERTKRALAELKAAGKELGNKKNLGGEKQKEAVRAANRKKKENNYNNTAAASTIKAMRATGSTLKQIADHLNKENIRTATGIEGKWSPTQVSRLCHEQ